MPRKRCWRASVGFLALLGTSLCGGCLTFVHPVGTPPHEDVQTCESIPQACKNRVHVFLVQGLDPLDLSNLEGVCDYLNSLGFIKTHFGLPFHTFFFEKEIRRIHAEEPTSRFVILGFSYGAPLARDLTCSLVEVGVQVDLLVYVDGVCLHQPPLDHPANALRVVSILSNVRGKEAQLEHAENISYPDVWHFGTPTHPQTLKMLVRELSVVALGVPIIEVMPPLGPAELVPPGRPALPILPPPQPASPKLPAPTPTDTTWNFLHPDGGSVGVPGSKPISEAWNTNPPATHQE
jgi:hypothetical protein